MNVNQIKMLMTLTENGLWSPHYNHHIKQSNLRQDRVELSFVRVSLSNGFSELGTWFRFVEKSGSGSDFHILLSNLLQFSFRNSFLHVSLLKTVMIPQHNGNSLGKKWSMDRRILHLSTSLVIWSPTWFFGWHQPVIHFILKCLFCNDISRTQN